MVILFRTQNTLMAHNITLCYSLNMANFFFGHDGTTAIAQVTSSFQALTNFNFIIYPKESLTGLVQGLSSYIHNHAPAAVGMPCIAYDHYFTHPWATKIEHEDRHRELLICHV